MTDGIRRWLTRRGLFTLLLSACVWTAVSIAPHAAKAEAPLSVVTTTGMLADAVREVGGPLVTVKALMGPGVDPPAYRQPRTDIVALAKADLVIWHGLYLEAQMEDFLRALSKRQRLWPRPRHCPATC